MMQAAVIGCVACRLHWPTVTTPSPSAFCLKSRPSFIRTSLVWRWSLCGFCFHVNSCCTIAQQNGVDETFLVCGQLRLLQSCTAVFMGVAGICTWCDS